MFKAANMANQHSFKYCRTTAAQIYERMEKDQDQARLNEGLKWLSNANPRARKADLCSTTSATAGSWFTASAEFKEWQDGSERLLCCPSILGAGKTVLAARAMSHLEGEVARFNGTKSLAYMFNDYKTGHMFNAARFLGSLLRQLVESRNGVSKPAVILHDDHLETQTYPTSEEIIRAIKSTTAHQASVFLVIDALDELPSSGRHRRQILETLLRLHAEISSIRTLVTCRPVPDIMERFKDCPRLEILAQREDVENHITSRFEDFRAPLDDDFRALIKDFIISAARGMFVSSSTDIKEAADAFTRFLWIRFIVDRFAEAHTKRQIRALIRELSSRETSAQADDTYTDLYSDTMRRIHLQSAPDVALADKTILWIKTAARLLTASELRCAFSIELGDSDYDDENVCSMDLILGVCAGLVVVDGSTQQVKLVHYTAQEYFEHRNQATKDQNHYALAAACLAYLCFDRFKKQEEHCVPNWSDIERTTRVTWHYIDPTGSNPTPTLAETVDPSIVTIGATEIDISLPGVSVLLDYAANTWALHARYCEERVSTTVLQLLSNYWLAARAFQSASSLTSRGDTSKY